MTGASFGFSTEMTLCLMLLCDFVSWEKRKSVMRVTVNKQTV